jgi:hypothetical protein
MLVDNPLYQQQQQYLSALPSSSFPDYSGDLNDIFDTELYNSTFVTGSSAQSTSSPGSRGSSPQSLLTPPQETFSSFSPEVHDDDNVANSFFNIFEEDLKGIDNMAMSTSSADFMGIDGAFPTGVNGYGMGMPGYGMAVDMTSIGLGMPPMVDAAQSHGIDPQLVDTPSAISDHGDDESDDKESPASPVSEKEVEKPTITIAPVKVGGHGKSRKGTVQSGGVVKKTVASTLLSGNKENPSSSLAAAVTKKATASKLPKTSALLQSTSPTPFLTAGDSSSKAESEAGDPDDDDELPHDWRPSPEVFAKMTSKEKRQLRNKISARNFRIRRKEYISTLEGDIAERDRLLDHFRTQLGSRESENVALRQEISALKKALLEGRGGTVNLPPPAPLPEQSAAEALAASASSHASSSLLTANTQKDLPTSPRVGNSFWGGVGIGSGITPVHTTLVPDISTVLRKGLQENMNPALNAQVNLSTPHGLGHHKPGLGGFDGFADLNPFTMKTLDAYRMHLWGKMASQHQSHPQQPNHLPSSGLASKLAPHYFSASSKPNLPVVPSSYNSSLSSLLSGKHSASSYPTPPASPLLSGKGLASSSPKEREMQQQREKEQQQAMLAAVASQTILRKLGGAFWDAFTGGSSSSSSSALTMSSSSSPGAWDADKVQRVLEGKAVLRVVDVEPTPKLIRPAAASGVSSSDDRKACTAAVTDLLEESMRSLTISKKM